jgi:hypothetical protein
MSSGQAVVYSGSDPGDSSNWSLVGIYDIGSPVNIRGVVKVGGDLLITTYDDYVSLKTVLSTGYIGSSSNLSGALQEEASNTGSSDGWQSILVPHEGFAIFNVPQTNGDYIQHVVNTTTGAWCRFTGIKSHVWAVFNGGLYFGGDDGVVYEYTGTDDNSTQIECIAQQAWDQLDSYQRKRIAAVRPVVGVVGTVVYKFGIGFNFSDPEVSSPSTATNNAQLWGTFTWDEWEWGGDEIISTSWHAGSGTGEVLSAKLRFNAKTEVSWYRTDYRVEIGIGL